MQRRVRSHTSNSHGPGKRVAVGNTAGRVPPAWRAVTAENPQLNGNRNGYGHGGYNDQTRRKEQHQQSQSVGSKIILSQLPTDTVSEGEVEHLFTTTIGPVFDCYLAHNSQGRSKGVAIVHFQRPGDALEARRKYNGKIIDGRRPLKIELIVDPPSGALPVIKKEKTLSLADRLSGPSNPSSSAKASVSSSQPQPQPPPPPSHPTNPRRLTARVKARAYRQTTKRAPRRTNKSAAELDQDMESYMAARKSNKPNTTES